MLPLIELRLAFLCTRITTCHDVAHSRRLHVRGPEPELRAVGEGGPVQRQPRLHARHVRGLVPRLTQCLRPAPWASTPGNLSLNSGFGKKQYYS